MTVLRMIWFGLLAILFLHWASDHLLSGNPCVENATGDEFCAGDEQHVR